MKNLLSFFLVLAFLPWPQSLWGDESTHLWDRVSGVQRDIPTGSGAQTSGTWHTAQGDHVSCGRDSSNGAHNPEDYKKHLSFEFLKMITQNISERTESVSSNRAKHSLAFIGLLNAQIPGNDARNRRKCIELRAMTGRGNVRFNSERHNGDGSLVFSFKNETSLTFEDVYDQQALNGLTLEQKNKKKRDFENATEEKRVSECLKQAGALRGSSILEPAPDASYEHPDSFSIEFTRPSGQGQVLVLASSKRGGVPRGSLIGQISPGDCYDAGTTNGTNRPVIASEAPTIERAKAACRGGTAEMQRVLTELSRSGTDGYSFRLAREIILGALDEEVKELDTKMKRIIGRNGSLKNIAQHLLDLFPLSDDDREDAVNYVERAVEKLKRVDDLNDELIRIRSTLEKVYAQVNSEEERDRIGKRIEEINRIIRSLSTNDPYHLRRKIKAVAKRFGIIGLPREAEGIFLRSDIASRVRPSGVSGPRSRLSESRANRLIEREMRKFDRSSEEWRENAAVRAGDRAPVQKARYLARAVRFKMNNLVQRCQKAMSGGDACKRGFLGFVSNSSRCRAAQRNRPRIQRGCERAFNRLQQRGHHFNEMYQYRANLLDQYNEQQRSTLGCDDLSLDPLCYGDYGVDYAYENSHSDYFDPYFNFN